MLFFLAVQARYTLLETSLLSQNMPMLSVWKCCFILKKQVIEFFFVNHDGAKKTLVILSLMVFHQPAYIIMRACKWWNKNEINQKNDRVQIEVFPSFFFHFFIINLCKSFDYPQWVFTSKWKSNLINIIFCEN